MSVPVPGRTTSTETSRFIAEHSLSFGQIRMDAQGVVSDYEKESLLMASGWKNFAATNSQIKIP
jgi:hypothetical protein